MGKSLTVSPIIQYYSRPCESEIKDLKKKVHIHITLTEKNLTNLDRRHGKVVSYYENCFLSKHGPKSILEGRCVLRNALRTEPQLLVAQIARTQLMSDPPRAELRRILGVLLADLRV